MISSIAAVSTLLCRAVMAFLAYFFFHNLAIKLRVDDPVDAFAVHFGGGFVGMQLPHCCE